MHQANAQQQFNCYQVQEFRWNSTTNLNDKPVEHQDKSKFTITKDKKYLIQLFDDGTSIQTPIKSNTNDVAKGICTYQVISPSNGYTYNYRINSNSQVIEISMENSGKETLLKKYLYKD